MIVCNRCKLPKSIGEFHPSHLKICLYRCISCHRDYATSRRHADLKRGVKSKRRRDELNAIVCASKLGACADCHNLFRPEQLDFDHVHGVKRFRLSIAYRKASSQAALKRELDKCDLVCANCHRDRTQSRLGDVRINESDVIIPESIKSDKHGEWYKLNRARVMARMKKRRLGTAEFIRSLKHNKLCVDCETQHPYWRLDFDHRDGKTINVSLIASRKHWGKERILEEVAKCELVCANCHRLRTTSRGQHLTNISGSHTTLEYASV
jgi:hypothetical protein